MAMVESDVRALQPKEKKYVKSTGQGLLVEVHPQGYKYFIWQYQYPPVKTGKRNTYHIGKYGKESEGLWSLKRAREEKMRLDVLRKQGHDPQLLKSTEKRDISDTATYTFRKVADEWLGSRMEKLSKFTIEDYRNKLDNQILPKFGNLSVRNISRSECVNFMKSHSDRAPEQARKLLMVMRQVFDYAIDMDWLEDNNPARTSKNTSTGHRSTPLPALEQWKDVPPFLVALSENKCGGEYQTVIAVKLSALLFLRASSLVSTKWSDISWKNKMLTTPAERMKSKREHLTPLSDSAIELFRKLEMINGNEEYCFYSPRGKKYPHLNPSSPNHHIKNLGFEGKHTTHGFRAMALTHGQERLKTPFHIIDLQLAHIKGDKIRQAYDRAQYMKERIKFMDEWSNLLVENGLEV